MFLVPIQIKKMLCYVIHRYKNFDFNYFQIAYDELFFDSVGRNKTKAWSIIQKVFVHVQVNFCHVSLGTKIHLNIGNSAHHIENLTTEFSFNDSYAINVVEPILKPLKEEFLENDNNVNAVVYLSNNEGRVSLTTLVWVSWGLELIDFPNLCMYLQKNS